MSLWLSVEENVSAHESFSVLETFGERESRRIFDIKNERRRAESLAGLVALKNALGDKDAREIVRDARGRPSFLYNGDMDFSISHSQSLSVAALIDSLGRVGVDIERIDEKKEDTHRRIAKRYFSDEERQRLASSPTPIEFFKIWTAKEARAKLSGNGLAEIISLDRAEKNEEGNVRHFLLTYKNEKYILAVCTDKDDEIDFICSEAISVSAIDINK